MQLTQLTKAVKLSDTDSEFITQLQKQLSTLSLYPASKIDGKFGPNTAKAWAEFKKQVSQSSPELIGPGSISLLLNKSSKSESLAELIVSYCKKRNYRLDNRVGAINIIGLEGFKVEDTPDKWNDAVCILSFLENGTPHITSIYTATTEPGKYYTLNPLNKNGAARLQLCQHKNLWALGKHRGYEALTQVGAAKLVRDKNKNYLRDDAESVESWNGINLHTTKTTGWRGSAGNFIGQWSAGCVVIKDPNSFLEFMKKVKNSLQYRQSKLASFDFTLIWYNGLYDV